MDFRNSAEEFLYHHVLEAPKNVPNPMTYYSPCDRLYRGYMDWTRSSHKVLLDKFQFWEALKHVVGTVNIGFVQGEKRFFSLRYYPNGILPEDIELHFRGFQITRRSDEPEDPQR